MTENNEEKSNTLQPDAVPSNTHVEEQTPFESNQNDNKPSNITSDNWDFHNKVQAVQPKSSHGGKSITTSKEKQFLKRRKHNKTQRNSRRINRKNKK